MYTKVNYGAENTPASDPLEAWRYLHGVARERAKKRQRERQTERARERESASERER
jgi:hypothetical protein